MTQWWFTRCDDLVPPRLVCQRPVCFTVVLFLTTYLIKCVNKSVIYHTLRLFPIAYSVTGMISIYISPPVMGIFSLRAKTSVPLVSNSPHSPELYKPCKPVCQLSCVCAEYLCWVDINQPVLLARSLVSILVAVISILLLLHLPLQAAFMSVYQVETSKCPRELFNETDTLPKPSHLLQKIQS